jgi:hypothetical protein
MAAKYIDITLNNNKYSKNLRSNIIMVYEIIGYVIYVKSYPNRVL